MRVLPLILVAALLPVSGSRAWARGQTGKYDLTIQDFDQALQRDPNDSAAFYGRGRAYALKGNYDRAIQDYDKALRINPNYADAFILRGNAFTEKHNYDLAIADFSQALLIRPNSADAFYNRALAYELNGNYDLAISDFDQTLRRTPNDADSFSGRGWAYAEKGEYSRAIQDYDQSLRLNPTNVRVVANRRLAYWSDGAYFRAMADQLRIVWLKFGLAGLALRLCLVVLLIWGAMKAPAERLLIVSSGRCPNCRSKLTIPFQPKVDEAILCPSCGSHLTVSDWRRGLSRWAPPVISGGFWLALLYVLPRATDGPAQLVLFVSIACCLPIIFLWILHVLFPPKLVYGDPNLVRLQLDSNDSTPRGSNS